MRPQIRQVDETVDLAKHVIVGDMPLEAEAVEQSPIDLNFVAVLALTCQRRACFLSRRTSIRPIFIDRRNYLARQNAPGRNPNEP